MKNADNHKLDSSELSVETSCDSSDPFNIFSENLSPIPASIVPRKLDFTALDDDGGPRDGSPAPDPHSPPYKRVGALRCVSHILRFCLSYKHHVPVGLCCDHVPARFHYENTGNLLGMLCFGL